MRRPPAGALGCAPWPTDDALLHRTAELAGDFLDRLPARPVWRPVDLAALRATLGGPIPTARANPRA